MANQKIIIMDFTTYEVHIFPYNIVIWGEGGEDFVVTHFSEQGQTFKKEHCQWMIVDTENTEKRLPIYIH